VQAINSLPSTLPDKTGRGAIYLGDGGKDKTVNII
jgi:hypothetical protein